jgi:hypothetical protein
MESQVKVLAQCDVMNVTVGHRDGRRHAIDLRFQSWNPPDDHELEESPVYRLMPETARLLVLELTNAIERLGEEPVPVRGPSADLWARDVLADGQIPGGSGMDMVISAFNDVAAAQRAADRLVESGFAAQSIHLHRHGLPAQNAAGVKVDEYTTGGLVSNVLSLLDGIFDTAKPPQQADSYTDVVKREEGLGVSVRVDNDADAGRAESILSACGATKVSRLPSHAAVADGS